MSALLTVFDPRHPRSARPTLGIGGTILALFCAACGEHVKPESYGLTLVELELTSDAMAELRHGVYTETPVPCHVTIDGAASRCNLAVAGATTRDDLKKNLDLELARSVAGRRRHRLSAMDGDPSALRAMLAFRVFAEAGHIVPQAEPIALWLNDTYAGLYLLIEPIDATFFENRGDTALSLYKARNLAATLDSTHDIGEAFASRLGEEDYADIRRLTHTIAESSSRRDVDELEALVHGGIALRYMAVSALIHNWDGIRNNYFLARTSREPRFTIYPWDVDQTFGERIDVAHGDLFGDNALMRTLYAVATDRYRQQLSHVARAANAARIASIVDTLSATISEAYEHDPQLNQRPLEPQAKQLQERAARQEAALEDLLRSW